MKKLLLILIGIILLIGNVNADLLDNIVTYYKLDNSSIYDELENNPGINSQTDNASGIISSCRDFEEEDGSPYDFINTTMYLGNQLNGDTLSVSVWFNAESSDVSDYQDVIISNEGATSEDRIEIQAGGSNIRFYLARPGVLGVGILNASFSYSTGNWYHVVATYDSSLGSDNMKLYINGNLNAKGDYTLSQSTTDNAILLGRAGAYTDRLFDGLIDEVGFWNRTLTSDEVLDLYNGGSGITYPLTAHGTQILLTSPVNGADITTTDINFSVTYNLSSSNDNWTNSTYYIYYDNGSIFNNSYTSQITGVNNITNQNFSNFIVGDYYWNVYACYENSTTTSCNWSTNGNFSFTVAGEFSNYKYNTSILETEQGYFAVDLTVPEGTSVLANSGRLIYNGTTYTGVTVTDNGDNNYTISKTFYIPSKTINFDLENRGFFWNITVIDADTGSTFTQSSATQTHNVTELYFGLCSAKYNIPILNFTLINESNNVQINGTNTSVTFQATFSIGANVNNLNKTYTINNQTVAASEFDFCTANYTKPLYSNMEAFYTASSFTDKNYYLNNATLTNTTNEINLYLLPEGESLEFFITVEQDLRGLAGATVNIAKYFVGEGVYKTVEIDETDTGGGFTAYLDLDKEYQFTITKNGETLGILTKRASCKAAPCTILLSITSDITDVMSRLNDPFAANVNYNLSFNPNTKIVTFNFVDTTGLATYFRMVIENNFPNQSAIIIYDKTTYSSSGSMTFNASNYTGDFTVNTYVSRSPEVFIDFIKFIINEIRNTLGKTGLFTALILILVVIFGFALKPSMLVMAVPLSVTMGKVMGFITLSSTSIVLMFILALIALFALTK